MLETPSTSQQVIERLKQGTGVRTDSELARLLGISQQSVSNARSTGKVPDSWVRCTAERFGLNADWLFFGRGKAHAFIDAANQPEPQSYVHWGNLTVDVKDARILDLERQLAAAKEETLKVYRLLAGYFPDFSKIIQER
ncbi:helix-turn-helix domain containing protein [Desulfovibrio sp. OttesenSCG-928-M16]|nr:helix-turn-helix domain containing protein [Desulfovibrio sp. OttesenSCG-928-M16]